VTNRRKTLPGFTRALTRSIIAVAAGVGLVVSLSGAIAPEAGAATATGGSVTYSATLNIPAPPPSNFSGSAGGDGWAVALSSNQVFNVFHHQPTLQVACHEQSDASECWSAPKTVTDGSGDNFATSIGPGLYLDQATGKLYVFVVRTSDSTAGVACIDITLPASATGAQLFCGFTPLSGVGDAPISSTAGLSAPVQVGTDWYSFNEVVGAPTGTENKLLCFDLATDSACAGQPFAVNDSGDQFAPFTYSYPIGAVGTDVFLQVVGSTDKLACFDTTTNGSCAGSWPITVTDAAGAPFPYLNSTGTGTGVCLPITGNPCYGLDGASVATPPGMAAAIGDTIQYNGSAIVLGARVYVPNANTNQVDCYDFSASAECANFPKSFSGLDLLYTVNPDPQRPTCIWVNSDNGVAQIQNFDAYTGGACGAGATRVLAASIVAPYNVCIPSNYTGLQVLVPGRSTYTTGTVQFEDFDGNPIPGIPQQNLDNSGSLNLTPFDLATKSPLPQFLITLNGESASTKEVDVKLTWTGTYNPQCTTGGQQVEGGQSYRLGASDGGVFTFGNDAFYGAMTGQHLNGPEVGMAATPDGQGYWLVASDGGVFTFGDASFYGSMGSTRLSAPVVGMAAMPDGKGYWLVAADGGVFTFGDAQFYGSTGGTRLNAPVVGIASTPDGKGYWLTAADGGVFTFGDAQFYGSRAGLFLNGPVVGISSTHDGNGYWLVASDGGVFTYGDAQFYGSMYGKHLNGPEVAMLATPDGNGYWLAASDGGVFSFGDAQFLGSLANSRLNAPIDSMSS
jgi:hypothetical protein